MLLSAGMPGGGAGMPGSGRISGIGDLKAWAARAHGGDAAAALMSLVRAACQRFDAAMWSSVVCRPVLNRRPCALLTDAA